MNDIVAVTSTPLLEGDCICTDEERWQAICGCGEYHIVPQQPAFHWKGKHWRPLCAWAAALEENAGLRALLIELAGRCLKY